MIYDQHDKSFAQVSSYAVLHNGEPVAKIAFKFPRDGAGRLYCYVQWMGTQMVRGQVSGYGYDKRTAAAANAMTGATKVKHDLLFAEPGSPMESFYLALVRDGGEHWGNALRNAGFTVFQTI